MVSYVQQSIEYHEGNTNQAKNGEWPSWPFGRVDPKLLAKLSRKLDGTKKEQHEKEIDGFEEAPF